MNKIAAIVLLGGLAAAFLLATGPQGLVPAGAEKFMAQVGAVGVNLGVLPNSYNTIAQQLEQKERQLNEREQVLQQREQEAGNARLWGGRDPLFYGLAGFAVLMFLLIITNFYLDHRREHSQATSV